ncbi:unnamed protein product [Ceratitis capitata]|uniref:(Mediterranean fruit fly) hypothetical protein n=1 Tax=Ceratitis capitata TaxID=7213 RepID=A0A811UU44_CERCA|nr:unnamed protein product [Ceratitis capitata]
MLFGDQISVLALLNSLIGNPGGVNFHEDENFVESYKLYKKRRELLKKKKLQSRVNADVSKENLAKKLEKRKIAILNNRLSALEACIVDDGKEAMINRYGIDIARLKGATFIDQGQISKYKNEQLEDKRQEEKKFKAAQEKKNFPMNVTIKNMPLKKRAHMIPVDLMMCWIKIYGTNYTNLLDIRQDSCCKSLANKDRRGNPIVVQSMVHVDPSSVKNSAGQYSKEIIELAHAV